MKKLTMILAILTLLVFAPSDQAQVQVQKEGQNPIYKITINVVQRTTKAINYRHRSGSTPIDFRGTPLLPDARGEAKVESKQGRIEVTSQFDHLQPATRFGPEYLTYVMWAITPEGRATNLGEVLLNGDNSKLDVTTDLQAFGLIVTAEPYFAVTQPSDVVVMENFTRHDTEGKVEEIDAKFELLQRGQYTVNVPPAKLQAMVLDKNTPLELYEARNAVRIAQWMGADRDAADSFGKANKLLEQAEAYKVRKAGTKPIVMTAREAAQTAEDARLVALKRQEDQRIAADRAASDAREAQAKADAARANADADQAARLRAQAEMDQKLEAERRARAEAESKAAQAQAERTRMEAQIAAERAARENEASKADADRAKADADRAKADADRSRLAADQAEREKQELRSKLVRQLNLILETRDTVRGLIVNMSDVLFDTGQFTLRPIAREKLAKVSGVILAYPGLKLQVEGHTDSVGSDDFNMTLSEKRAATVRDYLVQQGISPATITSRGFGENQPVASNETASGRQQNRRVELIVSGDIIGTPLSSNSGGKQK